MNWNHRWIWIRFKISSLCKILSFLLFLLRLAGRHLHAILCKDIWEKPSLGTKVRIRCLQNCGVHVLWAWPDRINASICVGEIHYLICYTFTYCATHTAQDLKLLLLFLRFLIFSMLLLFHLLLLLLLLHQHLSSVFVFVNQYTVFIWALCSHIFLCYFNNLLYDCYLLVTRFQRLYERFALARGQKHQQHQQQWLEKWTMTHKLLQAV